MLNKIKFINYNFFLKKNIFFLKKNIKINSFFLNKDLYIYNGKSYIFRKFNVFFLKKKINTNVLFKKPLAKPMKKKKKKC